MLPSITIDKILAFILSNPEILLYVLAVVLLLKFLSIVKGTYKFFSNHPTLTGVLLLISTITGTAVIYYPSLIPV